MAQIDPNTNSKRIKAKSNFPISQHKGKYYKNGKEVQLKDFVDELAFEKLADVLTNIETIDTDISS
jgi:hypothetical protein